MTKILNGFIHDLIYFIFCINNFINLWKKFRILIYVQCLKRFMMYKIYRDIKKSFPLNTLAL